jgi:hypothetical protein
MIKELEQILCQPNFIGNDKIGCNLAINAILDKIEDLGFTIVEKINDPILLGNDDIKIDIDIKDIKSNTNKITIVHAYEDSYISPFTLVPRGVLTKSCIDKIGKNINYHGEPKKIISVKLTEKDIIIELE